MSLSIFFINLIDANKLVYHITTQSTIDTLNILVIKFRNIGDVLLSTPLLENLKYHYPDATIDFALNQECESMISDNPNIRMVLSYDRAKIKSANFFYRILHELNFLQKIRRQHYDLVINLTEGDRGALIALLSQAKRKLGFPVRKGLFSKFSIFDRLGDDQKLQHTVQKDLQFIELLGKQVVKRRVSIYWPSTVETEIADILNTRHIKNFVHIHPVSRWMFKCWEDDSMANIIDFIQRKKHLPVVITGADNPKELQRIDKIISLCDSKPFNLAGQLNLKQLACLSAKAHLFFGVDTAPMHIAAATNTPVVALLGASEALKWGPWSNDEQNSISYRNHDGIQHNGVHSVFSNMDHTIFFENGIKKCKGMQTIDVNAVKQLLDEKL